jgi:hypothetical protein
MTFLYIVRCNFAARAREAAWNAWYSGPKIAQMLRLPHFLSCQRFRRAAGQGRDYLALWTMRSPQAMQTPEYLAQWGFDEWTSLISDWSRDLFDAGSIPAAAFAVPAGGALRTIAFDGLSEDEADRLSSAVARSDPGVVWLPIAGLDAHTPLIGLQVLAAPSPAPVPAHDRDPRVQEVIYRPVSEFRTAAVNP